MKRFEYITTKGLLEFLILNMIDTHSASVEEILVTLRKADKKAPMQVSKGTLYPLLAHMRSTGILRKSLEEMDDDTCAVCYCLTDKGFQRKSDMRKELHAMNDLIGKIKIFHVTFT